MKKRIEIVSKKTGEIYGSYDWHSRTFSYTPEFFEARGDDFHLTGGALFKTFDEVPYFFTMWLPTPGAPNFARAVKLVGANPDDLFDLISKLSRNIPASFFYRGVIS